MFGEQTVRPVKNGLNTRIPVRAGQNAVCLFHLWLGIHFLILFKTRDQTVACLDIPEPSRDLEQESICDTFFYRYLARVIYKLRLNSWNTKYSQNATCICKNMLSVKHILLECPITRVILEKWIRLKCLQQCKIYFV